ncbi:hypothetical protein Ddye_030632 [Dipteronia dyeriana]|uniref:Uncharacterized protein n=1 Tax=Dipteronia dyeriana TaxID=168575 RepID=A0AAD9TGN0_9ROSI|nr:hypothetical protein Ddye_030632 [Dipteronia dyeriana]
MTLDFSQAQAYYSSFRGNNMRDRSRGRGRGRNKGGSKFIYQLCGKSGHVVSYCFKRFDQSFQGTTTTRKWSQPVLQWRWSIQ